MNPDFSSLSLAESLMILVISMDDSSGLVFCMHLCMVLSCFKSVF